MKHILIILIFCLLSTLARSQNKANTSTPETTWQTLKYDVNTIFKSVGYSYSRPLHWQGKQWQNFGVIAAGSASLFLFDEASSDFFRRQQNSVPNFIRSYGEMYGSPENNYMVTSGVYLTGLFTKNEKLRRTGVLLIASATSAGLLQQITKSVVGRSRPVNDKGKATFSPFNSSRNYHSFPSGHAMLAFTNAYAIGKQFKNPWAKAGIYTVGLVPGVSRIWDGQHWLSDVALGVAISIFTVESIDRYLDTKYQQKYNDQQKRISWNLNFTPRQIGIVGQF